MYNNYMRKIILLIFFINIHLFAYSILIINSYHKGYQWSDKVIRGLEDVLIQKDYIDFNILYMDSKRISSSEYFESLKNLYKIQLRNRKYDLIIPIDRFAYDFVLENYYELFETEPILAVGIERFSHERVKKYSLQKKVSAILEKRDLFGNVNMIEKNFYNIKKLYIINDKSINGKHTEPLIEDLIKNFNNRIKLQYLKEDDLSSLKNYPFENGSAGLFIRFYKNKNGKLNKNSEIINFIKNSKIPIFVTDSLFVGKGATGGKIVDLYKLGKESGQMALDILNGKDAMVIEYKDFEYFFDYEKLNEFLLSIVNLSEPYTIIHKKKTFFDNYRNLIDFVFTISPLLVFLILGLIHNIYKRKSLEKDLRKRIEFDATMLNAIDSPIFWQDSEGRIVDSNNTFCNLLELSSDYLYGKKLIDLKDNHNIKQIVRMISNYNLNKNNNEFDFIDKDNNKKIYLIKQAKFKEQKIKYEGYVTIFTDITREREIILEKQKNRQFAIQQSKLAEIGEIFSSIAHQWKTPLIEITAIAQELFYTRKSKSQNINEDDSFVKDIMQQVTYMTDTINEFQKFIMPSNKKVDFNIEEAIETMLEIVNHNLKYNNIKISLNIKEGTNLIVHGYKNEVMQSILNIINNARDALLNNYYKDRKIEISLFNEKSDLIIKIIDNAKGINIKNINKIFEPYYTTKEKGHGIGLYMTKVIIEDKMNGKISVENIERGAMFTIRLAQRK
ncbi:sensor histidine kinase [Malaciobacter molluscorum]|nr:PAS domain-containing sensor histidine kinase [Malaciobacter molluscorum]